MQDLYNYLWVHENDVDLNRSKRDEMKRRLKLSEDAFFHFLEEGKSEIERLSKLMHQEEDKIRFSILGISFLF